MQLSREIIRAQFCDRIFVLDETGHVVLKSDRRACASDNSRFESWHVDAGRLVLGCSDESDLIFDVGTLAPSALTLRSDARRLEYRETSYSGRIHLVTCISADHCTSIIPHFVDHYRRLGVTDFIVLVNSHSGSAENLARVGRLLNDRGIAVVETWAGTYDCVTEIDKESRWIAALTHAHEWIVQADSDEFQTYPLALREFLGGCERAGINTVKGRIVDRIAADGKIRTVDSSRAIHEQFPVRCHFTRDVLETNDHKILAYKQPIRITDGNHHVRYDCRHLCVPYCERLEVDHFKWTAGVIEKLKARIATYRELNIPFWRESELFLEHYARHGRIACR